MADLVHMVVDDLQAYSDAKQIVLAVDIKTSPCEVSGHRDMLQIALRNMLDNAIRYSPVASKISVQLASSEGGIEVAIIDMGPGIPSIRRDAMFGRFKRGQDNYESGSGLGLSIVKRVCDIHKASIDMDAVSKDQSGLKVTIRFT